MNELQFRDVPESDVDRALELWWLVFHDRPDEKEKREYHRAMVLRCDRVGAYDGDALVGFLVAHRFTLSIPGGELPCPGLTFVSVAPTHRRRGVLSGMIAELFRRCADHARPVVALWASEAAIYGRFGFGAGTYGTSVEIDSTRPLALRVDPDRRPLRLIDADDAPAELGPYYEATRTRRAGRIARDSARWRGEWLPETDEDDEELGPPRIVGLGAIDEPLAGYAIYRTRREDDPAKSGTVQVAELEADTAAGEAALWNYLAGIDLTGTVRAWGLAPDDPLLLFAADRDQVKAVAEFPALWLRLVDVRGALTARSWAAEAFLVLEVRDDRVPANAGRFRLAVSPHTCTYEATAAAPDLSLDVRDLAACYLGGTEVRRLVLAGLVTEHTPGAAAALDAALRTAELPHTADEF
ncbi:GNAT family N-acetyltransferase [Streptomyces sp. NPDC006703]|uniref:GNAT family N-acetyltransferase n=1 Tax=Streptomyces sp. NPDC006703 TaxID=3364759 RepID=UPI0036BF0A3E